MTGQKMHRVLSVAATATFLAGGLVSFATPASADVERSRSAVTRFLQPDQVIEDASSKLQRHDDHVTMAFQTSELTAGEAHTVWWVVFNNPEACYTSPCSLRDFPPGLTPPGFGDGNAAAQSSQGYAAGHVVGGSGRATFAGRLVEGQPFQPGPGSFGPGLLDPERAEIHLVIRTHGPAIPGMVDYQIHSFNGGCFPGEPNVGLCRNLQASVHGT